MATEPSQSTRPPPSSPSLIALLELIPPSPILSPSDLSTSITSGEIPILLFENSDLVALSFNKRREQNIPLDSNPRTWELNLSRSTLFIADHGLNGISFDVSAELPDDEHLERACTTTFDTLGRPVHKNPRHRLSLCWTSNIATGDFTREGQGPQDQAQDDDSHQSIYYDDSWIGASQWDRPWPSPTLSEEDRSEEYILEPNPNFEIQGASPRDLTVFDSRSERFNLTTLACSSTSTSVFNLPEQRGSISSATQGTDFISFPTSSYLVHPAYTDDSCSREIEHCVGETSSIRGVSTMDSTSSLARRPAIHRACGSPKHRKEFQIQSIPEDAALLSRSQISNVQATAQQGYTLGTDWGISSGSPDIRFSAAVNKLPPPSQSPFTPLVVELAQPPRNAAKPMSPSMRTHEQNKYPWLRNITISLVIDQEGFRTILPTFRQTGISRRRLLDAGDIEVDVVTFVPATAKQAFRFHYAPFDGLPILRRLIVNGDETRDFLSRQAYLSLKSSGTYTVHGTEIASLAAAALGSLPPLHDTTAETGQAITDPTRLYWQFDYSVEDRRTEQTGKVMDGEKILVPLTFTCSPRLLHPNQGKKIKLIQIVKKTVVPKLTAEKKLLVPSRFSPLIRTPLVTPPTSAITPFSSSARPIQLPNNKWNLHMRSQSNPREMPKTSFSPPLPFPHVTAAKSSGYSTTRRHCSSAGFMGGRKKSVGEAIPPKPLPIPIRSLPSSPPLRRRRASSAGESSRCATVHQQPMIETGVYPVRYIHPPSRLRQLVEEEEAGNNNHEPRRTKEIVAASPHYFLPLEA